MSLLSKILRPANSIFILFSWKELHNEERLASILDETSKYYKASPFQLNRKGQIPQGCCFFGIDSARRDVVEFSLPRFMEKKIPVTLFLEPARIGTNRLSFEEEARLLAKETQLSIAELEALLKLGWEDPRQGEAQLSILRKKLGHFPVEKTVPTELHETWGRLRLLNPELVNFGIQIASQPNVKNLVSIREDIHFANLQLPSKLSVAYCREAIDESVGMPLLTAKTGAIDSQTPLNALPTWDIASRS